MEIIITDVEGNNHKYYIICRFYAMDREYIALAPQSGGNVVELFRCIEDEDGKINVEDIFSDMEFESVKDAYQKIAAEEINNIEDSKDTTIIITRDDGSECVCNIVSLFEYDSKDYIALMPLEPIGSSNEDLGDEADARRAANFQIVLYGYTSYDDNRGATNISLIPIPPGQYPSIEAYFMDMVMNDDEGVSMTGIVGY